MLIDVIGYSACLVGLALCWRGLQGIPRCEPSAPPSSVVGYDCVAESLQVAPEVL